MTAACKSPDDAEGPAASPSTAAVMPSDAGQPAADNTYAMPEDACKTLDERC
jgi:hypothetical protein